MSEESIGVLAQAIVIILGVVCIGVWLSPPWYAYFPIFLVIARCVV